ncbi:dihydroflavonol-4-reductase [Quillaja saponaria]|uniref:Dihydroflavonol-4-reductase n=1 Tax=Quillaja saponaria TaxID=32244 RepID=A0AAD7QHL9_QUISA|nr:dihydroflavonol-4-reductase [Quillaja saponaria]
MPVDIMHGNGGFTPKVGGGRQRRGRFSYSSDVLRYQRHRVHWTWLVVALLERGFKVHATVRDPAKTLHLLHCGAAGCDGVFHVAASIEFNVNEKENTETYVQANIIDPAIKGTLNLLKTCLKSKSVKNVVFTSSISTITAKDSDEKWRPIVDESCQTPIDHIWNTKASGWVYVLSKRLTEEAAFKFAKENSIDLVSVITTTVAGPFFTANLPSSIQILLSPITGDTEFFKILSAVNARMGSISLVLIQTHDPYGFMPEDANSNLHMIEKMS